MFRKLLLISACIAIGGCELVKVVTFEEDLRSFHLQDQRVVVQAIGPRSDNTKTAFIDAEATNDEVLAECRSSVSSQDMQMQVAPGAAPFILAGATILVNELAAELDGYIETEKKKFSKSYNGAINVAPFNITGLDAVRCLRIQRIVTDKDIAVTAFDFVVLLKPISKNALVLTPVFLSLTRSAARTSKSAGTVDLDIAIAISVIRRVNNQNELYVAAQKNFAYPGVPIDAHASSKNPHAKIRFADSAVFPIPDQPADTAATIAISIQETGSGADDFGSAVKSIEANKGAVGAAIDGYLKERL